MEERFYSRLGKALKPGVIARVVLAAFEKARRGERLISMTGGSYDPESLPIKEVEEALAEIPEKDWRGILQYGNNLGSGRLRVELAKFVGEGGIEADPTGEIIVTTGSQQALDLISRVFLDPGDLVLVGEPTYLQALASFRLYGAQIETVPLDEEGMDVETLEERLKELKAEGKKAKLLYTVPSYQNPTGTMMPEQRRRRLLELAGEYDFLIVEDNPYGYLTFEGEMPPPIKAYDEEGRVIYLSTFSKIVSPGLRIGWAVGRRGFIEKMAVAKVNVDICSDGLSQYVAAELLRKGLVQRQIDRLRRVYREKRDLMLESMELHFPEEAGWQEPKGGIFLWVEMPEGFDADGMLEEAIRRGVAYIPGSNFFTDPNIRNHLRLNYSYPSREEIPEGIRILGKLLSEAVKS
jgi:2-aminoadipate transaminase